MSDRQQRIEQLIRDLQSRDFFKRVDAAKRLLIEEDKGLIPLAKARDIMDRAENELLQR